MLTPSLTETPAEAPTETPTELSLEQLINLAKQPSQSTTDRDHYKKMIFEKVDQLKKARVRLINHSELLYEVLDKTLKEQQREKTALLGNSNLTPDQIATLNAADPASAKDAHTVDQVIALDAALNAINWALAQPKLPPVSTKMVSIDFSNLGLTRLTNGLMDMLNFFTNLISLQVNNNLLTELPDSIGTLASLCWLHLENNQLTRLPESLGNLVNVSQLSAQKNQLTTLPNSLIRLEMLCFLDIRDNPLPPLLPTSLSGLLVKTGNQRFVSTPPPSLNRSATSLALPSLAPPKPPRTDYYLPTPPATPTALQKSFSFTNLYQNFTSHIGSPSPSSSPSSSPASSATPTPTPSPPPPPVRSVTLSNLNLDEEHKTPINPKASSRIRFPWKKKT